jgi:multicomponent Na+:H+ antiporter subunit E
MSLVLRPYFAARLFVLFLWDLVVSSVQVARVVIAPGDRTAPRFVTIPLRAESDLEILLVANFISLTPGTLSVDVSPDRRTLLVHDLLAGADSTAARAGVRDGIEARVLKATRS